MAGHDCSQVAQELIEAFNAGDWDRFRATLAPAVVYQETGTGRRVEGVDAYVQLCQGWKEAFPDARGTIQAALASGDRVDQEVTWVGTHSGPLEGPGGSVPPTNKRIEVQGALWYTFAGDKAREIHHHLDVLSMLQQLGVPPAPPAATTT